ncbi:protein of unknown function [Pararobbsia alpina]
MGNDLSIPSDLRVGGYLILSSLKRRDWTSSTDHFARFPGLPPDVKRKAHNQSRID